MIEVTLKVRPNVIRETLNRIGVKVRPPEPTEFQTRQYEKALVPSVYLYHTNIDNETKFFLIHFKEWFLLHQRNAYDNVSQDDRDRLAFITKLLRDWGMVDCNKDETIDQLTSGNLTIVKKAEVDNWFIAHKIKF
jgi:hypothetical protein